MKFHAFKIGATALLASHLLVGCGPSGSEDDPKQQPPSFTEAQAAHLDALVTNFVRQEKFPNLSIGVVVGGDLVWQKGFGAGPTPGKAPDADSSFLVDTLSGIVTTTALLTLVENGVLSLDDEAATWLPEASGALESSGMGPVTVRHLLSNTSGIPTNGNRSQGWHRSNGNVTEADLFAALEGVQPSFQPGTEMENSLLGMGLVGLIIERASGKSFRDYVRESVLQPLEMNASTWDIPASGLAPGHDLWAAPVYEPVSSLWRHGAAEPGVGLFSTVSDLSRLAAHALGHRSLLLPATLEESMTPVLSIPGAKQVNGLGWIISEIDSLGKMAWRLGVTPGYASFLALLPEHDVAVVVLAGTYLGGDVLEMVSLSDAVLSYLVDESTDVRPVKSQTPQEVIDQVGERLLPLLQTPTAEALREAFDPDVVEFMTEEAFLGQFEGLVSATGTCSSFEVTEDFGHATVTYLFTCAKGLLPVIVHGHTTSPYQLFGFSLY